MGDQTADWVELTTYCKTKEEIQFAFDQRKKDKLPVKWLYREDGQVSVGVPLEERKRRFKSMEKMLLSNKKPKMEHNIVRICLKCRKPFTSKQRDNRLCMPCRHENNGEADFHGGKATKT